MDIETPISELIHYDTLIRQIVGDADEEQLRAASALPGWTRAHVVAHIAGTTHAMARQLEYAQARQTIQIYDGGQDGRAADIERRASLAPVELRHELDAALSRLLTAVSAVDTADIWSVPITYRDGTAADGLNGIWREWAIHVCDLDLGVTNDHWSRVFCVHLFDFLSARVPANVHLVLAPDDDDEVSIGGDGSEVRAGGRLADLAGWLTGRTPANPVRFEPAEPILEPWPPR